MIRQSYEKKWTVTIVAVATTKFFFGMCDCTPDSDVGTDGFSLFLKVFHVCGHAHVRSHISPCVNIVALREVNEPLLQKSYHKLHFQLTHTKLFEKFRRRGEKGINIGIELFYTVP